MKRDSSAAAGRRRFCASGSFMTNLSAAAAFATLMDG